jgi:2-oxoglutarate ferredoxin oxidoreductase subunit beta
VTFGPNGEYAIVLEDGQAKFAMTDSVAKSRIVVHDEKDPDPSLAFALSRLSHTPVGPTPIGVFRDVTRPTYEEMLQQQIVQAQEEKGPGDLGELIRSLGTWEAT